MSPYAWTTNDDEVDLNAVTVGIGAEVLAAAGVELSPCSIAASVYWAAHAGIGGHADGWEQFYEDVPGALARAEQVRAMLALPRVVITMDKAVAWDDAWGELAPVEGLNLPRAN